MQREDSAHLYLHSFEIRRISVGRIAHNVSKGMESKINQCREKHQCLTRLWFPQWLALLQFICLLNTQPSHRGIVERHLGLGTYMFSIELYADSGQDSFSKLHCVTLRKDKIIISTLKKCYKDWVFPWHRHFSLHCRANLFLQVPQCLLGTWTQEKLWWPTQGLAEINFV